MTPGLRNWRTTALGVLGALVVYGVGCGWKLPESKQEWTSALGGVLVALYGYFSRDAVATSEMSGVANSMANLKAKAAEADKTKLRVALEAAPPDIPAAPAEPEPPIP